MYASDEDRGARNPLASRSKKELGANRDQKAGDAADNRTVNTAGGGGLFPAQAICIWDDLAMLSGRRASLQPGKHRCFAADQTPKVPHTSQPVGFGLPCVMHHHPSKASILARLRAKMHTHPGSKALPYFDAEEQRVQLHVVRVPRCVAPVRPDPDRSSPETLLCREYPEQQIQREDQRASWSKRLFRRQSEQRYQIQGFSPCLYVTWSNCCSSFRTGISKSSAARDKPIRSSDRARKHRRLNRSGSSTSHSSEFGSSKGSLRHPRSL